MRPLRIRTATEQVARHLREEILRGSWKETMPGTARLAREMGVGMRTVADALDRLESEGLLVSQGRRRKRRIVVPEDLSPPGLRVAILLYEASDGRRDFMTELLLRLSEEGHRASFCDKSLLDLKMDPARIERFTRRVSADAWIVFAGSREVLDWFSRQSTPAFAIAGRLRGVDIAGSGPDKSTVMQEVVGRLFALGHRRMVLLAREERRKPTPAVFEQTFLDQIEAHGIPTGSYNMPDWPNHAEGLHKCLDSLFRISAPTALIIEEAALFFAVQQHLAQSGITAPSDISLVCGDPDPAFDWCRPTVAHITWDSRKLVRRMTRWTYRVARGIDRRRQLSIKATFVDGGTVGVAPHKARGTHGL